MSTSRPKMSTAMPSGWLERSQALPSKSGPTQSFDVELVGLARGQGEDLADAGAQAVVLRLEPDLDAGALQAAVLDVDRS